MKEVAASSVSAARRLGVAEAKSKLSEVLRDAVLGPTIIHNRGRDLVVLLAMEEYQRLLAEHPGGPGSGSAFLNRIEGVKRRHGGGVEQFEPAHMTLQPVNPFARRRASRT